MFTTTTVAYGCLITWYWHSCANACKAKEVPGNNRYTLCPEAQVVLYLIVFFFPVCVATSLFLWDAAYGDSSLYLAMLYFPIDPVQVEKECNVARV